MDLTPLRDFVIDQEPDYEEGRNLFMFHMPAQVQIGTVLVVETPGAGVDHEIPGTFKQRIQAIVRHSDYTEGQNMARRLYDMLNLRRVQIGGYYFHYIMPRHLPIPYRRGESGLVEFSVNYDTHFAET